MDEIVDWLGFYNSRRLHSTLDYVSPMTFEKNLVRRSAGASRIKLSAMGFAKQGQDQSLVYSWSIGQSAKRILRLAIRNDMGPAYAVDNQCGCVHPRAPSHLIDAELVEFLR
ncbi:hypothetical protein B0G57_1376 [Trinickia symbiotica]|nr:hypothetical protein B0G57_1376 [Trinickia symbiotica]